ncbi:hypothetical protein D5272_11700 [bacterium D16-76]|nr:hypothetical protein [bacterium D16-76]
MTGFASGGLRDFFGKKSLKNLQKTLGCFLGKEWYNGGRPKFFIGLIAAGPRFGGGQPRLLRLAGVDR